MKCSAFIATDADGYIATKNGDVDWLEKAGNPDADMGEQSDMGEQNEMTITHAPLLLGDGIPLFWKINSPVKLEDPRAQKYPNDFIQIKYKVHYL